MEKFQFSVDLPPGLNSDDTTFAASSHWADCNNVRFVKGRPEAVRGSVFNKALAAGSNCKSIGYHSQGTMVVGMETKLYTVTLGASPTVSDITPASLGLVSEHWAFAIWGSYLLAAPNFGKLYVHTGTGVATRVMQAPAQMRWMLVTPQRQVMAFGCNEEISGALNLKCIRWSDIEDYTNWTTTAENNAGEHVIEDDGPIIGARLIGQYVAVWTDTSLFMGTFIGDPAQTYRFDRVATDCGLSRSESVALLDDIAYWISPDRTIFRWVPGARPEKVPCPIHEEFVANASLNGCHMFAVHRYGEIWLHYKDGRDLGTSPTRYIAFNVTDGTWFRGTTAAQAVLSHPSAEDYLHTAGYHTGSYVVGSGTQLNISGTGNTGTWYIQTADIYLQEGRQRVMVHSIEPDFETQHSTVEMAAYVRAKPQESATAKGPYSLTASADRLGCRFSGKLLALRFSGTGPMRMGKHKLNCTILGER